MTVPLAGSCCQVIRDLRVIFRFHNKKKEEMSTIGRQVNREEDHEDLQILDLLDE